MGIKPPTSSSLKTFAVLALLCSAVIAIPPYRWYVNASSTRFGFTWIACSIALPSQAATTCLGAALLIGLNAVIQAHGGSGQTGANVKRGTSLFGSAEIFNPDLTPMYHYSDEGTFDFINTTALTLDWHHVHLPSHAMNLTVRRLADGRIHARTAGFSAQPCSDSNCPAQSLRLEKRASNTIEELDFSWTEPANYATATQTGVSDAANGAAGYVAGAGKGTDHFCSNAITGNGLVADVSITFYGAGVSSEIPPACGF